MKNDMNSSLLSYCRKMSMSYSYKPVLILALLDNHGKIRISDAAYYFTSFYGSRLRHGLVAEKNNSIYSNLNCSYKQMRQNIINNPVKALTSSSQLFKYDSVQEILEIDPLEWNGLSGAEISAIAAVCHERIAQYYKRITIPNPSDIILFQDPEAEYGFLTNAYYSEFMCLSHQFISMSQYMSYRKALILGKEKMGRHILRITSPHQLCDVVEELHGLGNCIWDGQKQVIAYQGLISKFTQNPQLTARLLDTGSSILAACSPLDSVWGIGLHSDDENAYMIDSWKGQNLLGFTLMQVRGSVYSARNL